MNVGQAATVARQHLAALIPKTSAADFRLEEFLWDDHLGFWTLTLGYTPQEGARAYKIVRVSEADKAVLSVKDR
ncbi:MAG TPA: hypothetical protein VGG57_16725 [Stellaceae bacterium]|jgi:hypothetical protein